MDHKIASGAWGMLFRHGAARGYGLNWHARLDRACGVIATGCMLAWSIFAALVALGFIPVPKLPW